MCGSPLPKPKTPKVENKPVEAPPPPEKTPEAPVVEGTKRSGDQTRRAKKTGTGALRIDLSVAQPGGRGLNIPTG